MNIPNIIMMLACLSLPVIFKKRLLDATIVTLLIVGLFYFPFLYFTNGGNEGAAPFYFIMLVCYYAFYLRGKQLIIITSAFLIIYPSIMVFGHLNPDLITPYTDSLTRLIDILIAVASISITLALIANTTFRGYQTEKERVLDLAKNVIKQNELLEELSIRDQLTEIYNRGYFIDRLELELENINNHFYLMMIDLDDFKVVNDTYGHLYGDEVLRRVSKMISKTIRTHDIVARYGGEELVVIVTNSTYEDAVKVANRLLVNVAGIEYRNKVHVTISIGLTKSNNEDDSNSIIDRADDLMYQAKEKGKNQFVSDYKY